MAKTARTTISCGFGSLMDIDKLIRPPAAFRLLDSFGSLMDIDKLIHKSESRTRFVRFGSLMDIDKLILRIEGVQNYDVLVL